MITKHNAIVIAVSVMIAAAIPFIYKAPGQKEIINYKTFHSDSGWGYNIVLNGKLIIHQEYIPAIAEKKGFSKEIEAGETAQLVISKLKNNKSPTLSKTEVEQICGGNN
ncbi:MAG: DUF4907 domain-containing protein [Chitinophagales bacterium]